MSIASVLYGSASSSRVMDALTPFGVAKEYRVISEDMVDKQRWWFWGVASVALSVDEIWVSRDAVFHEPAVDAMRGNMDQLQKTLEQTGLLHPQWSLTAIEIVQG